MPPRILPPTDLINRQPLANHRGQRVTSRSAFQPVLARPIAHQMGRQLADHVADLVPDVVDIDDAGEVLVHRGRVGVWG